MRTLAERLLHRWWLILAVALLALVLAACGGGDDDDSAGGDGASQTTEASGDAGEGDDDDAEASQDAGDDDDAGATEDAGNGGDGNTGENEVCQLVSADEVNAITSSDYAITQDEADQCTYEDSDFHGIYVLVGGESSFETSLDALGGEEFDGPGERTAWAGGFYTLDALENGRTYTVQAVTFDGKERETAIAIMEKILD